MMPKIQSLFPKIFIPSLFLLASTPAQAQITPDNTLGAEASSITPNALINGANADLINGGAQRSGNLFHSFIEFNINNGQSVYFGNPSGVQNILTRVTGGNASNILGILGVNGNANLFLINPNGILFGQNASLDIRGSFVGTTANAVQFGNQGIFSATNPQAPPLLTVNPSALLFNQINQNAAIQNNGVLEVTEGKSLLLVGGNISMDGGILFAPGGRVELGGLAEAGNVGIQQDGNILSLNFPVQVERADVLLNNSAGVSVISGDGGSVAINARNIDILGGSLILAGIGRGLGTADSKADDITLNATREIKVEQGSYIRNAVISNATGNGGNLTINAQNLLVQSGGRLQASTLGKGEGGNLTVNASDKIELVGTSADGLIPSGLFTFTLQPSTRNAGNITINTQDLFVRDGAQVAAATLGAGKGGDLTVNASRQIELVGTSKDVRIVSGLFASAQQGSIGDAGDLTINTQNLFIRDGAQVNTSTFGVGKAGNLTVNASEKVELIDQEVRALLTGLASSSELGSTGDAGDLTINTQNLLLQDRAQIATSTSGTGKGGNLSVNASKRVELVGGTLTASAEPLSTGDAGNLTINTPDLLVRDGGQVLAATAGTGKGGNLSINASYSVQVIGESADSLLSSGLFTSAQDSTGNAGDLTINTPDLLVRDGAQVGAGTFGAGDGGKLTVNASNRVQIIGESADGLLSSGIYISAQTDSTGNAGNLTINTQDLIVRDGAVVSAETFAVGKGGNLTVNASKNIELVGTSVDGSVFSGLISAANQGSSGNAGDLTIKTPNLLVGDRAQVSVTSEGTGNAGIMSINADSIRLNNNGSLNANTRSPNKDPNREQATINLNSPFILLLRNSNITTNATGENVIGGNININTDILAALQNSDISANSTDSRGGRVRITAQGIFGTQPRNFLTPESDITATGANPDLSGTTEINTPDVDPTKGLTELPTEVIDASTKFSQICPRDPNPKPLAKFVVTGRGSLPPSPLEFLTGTSISIPLATLEEQTATLIDGAIAPVSNPSPEIIEAQGWIKTANGIVLVANAAIATLSSRQTAAVCPHR
ncbi:MAG: S-layer family protein [Aulosira sp. DedQUE10]|nr:S-layer family protein [Aulosira sp. DedQUE10]